MNITTLFERSNTFQKADCYEKTSNACLYFLRNTLGYTKYSIKNEGFPVLIDITVKKITRIISAIFAFLLLLPLTLVGIALLQLSKTHKNAYRDAQKHFQKLDNTLKNILSDNPSWINPINGWKNIFLKDKICLLQLYELRNLNVEIPQIDALHQQQSAPFTPSIFTLDLLKPDTKQGIHEALAKVSELNLTRKGLQKCPEAIYLLVNLQILRLNANKLSVPPDVSKNIHLQSLDLGRNQLKAPPDVSKNIHLKTLFLYENQITIPPDISKNGELDLLNLCDNLLTVSPDVSQNLELVSLSLHKNKLTMSPDVTRNIKLRVLGLGDNQLIDPPNLSKNQNLGGLDLYNNQLTTPPDVSHNLRLKSLNLSSNKLRTIPDISKNICLRRYNFEHNPLGKQVLKELEKLQSRQPNMDLKF